MSFLYYRFKNVIASKCYRFKTNSLQLNLTRGTALQIDNETKTL
jgi:hypothetical protein